MGEDATPAVMVVDDYDDTRSMMKTLLEMKGYRVVEAASGEQAVEVAGRERLDLIFMDLCLTGIDGLTAARIIRGREESRDVPVVVVSGRGGARLAEEALEAGCAEYLVKPLDFKDVDGLLRRFCPVGSPPASRPRV